MYNGMIPMMNLKNNDCYYGVGVSDMHMNCKAIYIARPCSYGAASSVVSCTVLSR